MRANSNYLYGVLQHDPGLNLRHILKRPVVSLSLSLCSLSPGWSQIKITGPSTCPQGQVCQYEATRGKAPYVFSMVPGSVGSIDPSTGAYTAPAHVVPKQVINGCQGLPNNSVINTRVDALAVHPKNRLWMSNVDPAYVLFTSGMRIHKLWTQAAL